MKLILLGPPGAGKGTQSEILKNSFGIPHISTGDILRQALKEKSAISSKIKGFVDSGELVPDEIVLELIRQRLSKPDAEKGFILDGFPRNLKQAEDLDAVLKKLNIDIDMVLYFATTLSTIITRLSGRRVCSDCGANYHVKNMPAKVEGICNVCGGKLYQRKDDLEETVRRRIDVYLGQTAGLIKYYQAKKKLFTLNGDRDAREVNRELNQIFLKEGLSSSLK